MTLPPELALEDYKQNTFLELAAARDRMIAYMKTYETDVCTGTRTLPEWRIQPNASVFYLDNLELVSGIVEIMNDKIEAYCDEHGCLREEAIKALLRDAK